jgi:hypothetical protein
MCGHHYIQTNTNNVKKNVVFLFHFVILEILISHYEHFILHIFASILCVICKYNCVSNGRSHYYPGSGCPRCKGVDFQIKYIYIYIIEIR